MSRRRFQEIAVGVLVVGGGLVFIFLAFKVGGAGFGRKNVYIISAHDALGLVENSSVMIAGVEIGRVKNLDVSHGNALITISIKHEIVLRKGTRFYIRGKSLLGEKYLDVRPGPDDAEPLPQNVVLDVWATHETEMGDFVSKIDREYMPSPEEFRQLMSGMLLLLAAKKEEIANLIDWLNGISQQLPPEGVGNLLSELKSDLELLKLLKSDYLRWRTRIDSLLQLTEQLSNDYLRVREKLEKYGKYAPSPTSVVDMVERMNRLLDSTSELICNLNFQLHKFDNVDFETIMEILEDRGFKVRFWGRSSKEREKDLKLFRSYPKRISGEGCR